MPVAGEHGEGGRGPLRRLGVAGEDLGLDVGGERQGRFERVLSGEGPVGERLECEAAGYHHDAEQDEHRAEGP